MGHLVVGFVQLVILVKADLQVLSNVVFAATGGTGDAPYVLDFDGIKWMCHRYLSGVVKRCLVPSDPGAGEADPGHQGVGSERRLVVRTGTDGSGLRSADVRPGILDRNLRSAGSGASLGVNLTAIHQCVALPRDLHRLH